MLVEAAGKTGRFVSSCGGTRSGKTYSMLQFLYLLSASDTKATITSVVSETFPHLRKGAMRDFKAVVSDLGGWDESRWSKSESTYTFPSGAVIEFFSADSPAKVHGPARDRLFINEAQNIDYDTARQMFVRTRDYIYIDYNPTHSFWVNEQIESEDDCVTIHSTYLNNVDRRTGESMLTEAQVKDIERNRDKDRNWWRVYGEGKIGRREGVIYDFVTIDGLPDTDGMVEVYGLDFGYTNDPSVLVHVLADTKRKVLYIDEEFYETGMLNRDIVARMKAKEIRRTVEVFADSAEPKSCDEIAFAGFNCKKCYKGKSVVEQIQFLLGWELKVTKRSLNLIKELRNYSWMEDKDGRLLNEPQGGLYDHGCDALRYAVFTKLGTFRKPLTGGRAKTQKAW